MEPRPRLDWHLLDEPSMPASRRWSATSTGSTASCRRCTSCDCDPAGFEWVDPTTPTQSCWLRRARAATARMRAGGRQLHADVYDGYRAGRAARRAAGARSQHRLRATTAAAMSATPCGVRMRARGRPRARSQSSDAPAAGRHFPRWTALNACPQIRRTASRPPRPLGASWDGRGINFALFSANAEKVELCLFDGQGRRETRAHRSCRSARRTSGTAICTTSRRASSTAIASMGPMSPSTATASTPTSCCSIPMRARSPAGSTGATRISATAPAARARTSFDRATTRAACPRPRGRRNLQLGRRRNAPHTPLGRHHHLRSARQGPDAAAPGRARRTCAAPTAACRSRHRSSI